MSEWVWTCTGCGEQFSGITPQDAQSKFFAHVGEKHPNALVMSVNTDEGAQQHG